MNKIIDRSLSVIVSFVSDFILEIILEKPNTLILTVAIVLVFLVWVAAYDYLVKLIKYVPSLKRNPHWQLVLLKSANFMYMLLVFLVIQLSLQAIKSSVGDVNPSFFESAVSVFVLIIAGFSVVAFVSALSSPLPVSTVQPTTSGSKIGASASSHEKEIRALKKELSALKIEMKKTKEIAMAHNNVSVQGGSSLLWDSSYKKANRRTKGWTGGSPLQIV